MRIREQVPKFVIQFSLLMYLTYKAISVSLWINIDRQFPMLPIFNIREPYLHFIDLGLNMLALIVILFLMIFPRKRGVLLMFILLEMIILSLDQMRWQPLAFQMLIFLSVLFISPGKAKGFLYALLGATYIFSGLHKLNPGFHNIIWSDTLLYDLLGIPAEIAFYKWVKLAGYSIGLSEFLLGIGLFTRWRSLAKIGLIMMHIFLLFFLISTGKNPVILPWNVLMIFYLGYFWYTDHRTSIIHLWKPIRLRPFLILIFILPVFRFFDAYPPYFSFDLYSGNDEHLFLYTDDARFSRYADARFTDHYVVERKYAVSMTYWALSELKVPVPPDRRLFKEIREQLEVNHATDLIYTYFPYRQTDCREL